MRLLSTLQASAQAWQSFSTSGLPTPVVVVGPPVSMVEAAVLAKPRKMRDINAKDYR